MVFFSSSSPFDALDDGLELVFCKCCRRLFLEGAAEVAIGYSLIERMI